MISVSLSSGFSGLLGVSGSVKMSIILSIIDSGSSVGGLSSSLGVTGTPGIPGTLLSVVIGLEGKFGVPVGLSSSSSSGSSGLNHPPPPPPPGLPPGLLGLSSSSSPGLPGLFGSSGLPGLFGSSGVSGPVYYTHMTLPTKNHV